MAGLLAVEAQTGETPQVLVNQPKLHPWLQWYYDAFWELDPGRAVHEGSIGRIPFSEIAAWIQIYEIDDMDSRELLVLTLRSLDSMYVRLVNQRIKREMDQHRKEAERRHGR